MSTLIGVEGVHYRRGSAQWEARGRAGLALGTRANLVAETDRPIPGVNAGVYSAAERPRGADIRPANQGEYALAVGQTLANCDVYGTLYMPSGSTIDNVRVFGSPADANPGINSHKPLVRTPSGATNVTIKDSTLQPSAANESDQAYGIKGRGFTLLRSVIARCVDSFQVWDGSATIQQSWLGDPYLRNPDRTRSDGQATHADFGGQLQGGANNGVITYIGSVLDGWMAQSVFDAFMSNGNGPSIIGILVTDDVKVNNVPTAPERIRVYGCWLRGGSYPINVSTYHRDFEANGWLEAAFLRNRIEKGQSTVSGEQWHAIAHTTNVQSRWNFPTTGADANIDVTVSGTGVDQTWTPTGNPIRIKAG